MTFLFFLLSVALGFFSFIVLTIILAILDLANTTWIVLSVFFISILIAGCFFIVVTTKEVRKRKTSMSVLMMSNQKRKRKFRELFSEAARYQKQIEKADNSTTFFDSYDSLIDTLEKMIFFEGMIKNINVSVKDLLLEWTDNASLNVKVRKYIDRLYKELITKIEYESNNDEGLKNLRIEEFETEMNLLLEKGICNEETKDFIEKKVSELLLVVRRKEKKEVKELISPEDELKRTDFLEGIEFEDWCADLLKKMGYSNITKTATSGDQGVDLLAEKEEVKYAVQCKCYSSPLGNTAVQEVYAGKAFYKCQVGIVMTNSTFTEGAKEVANSIGILLWDRGKLLSILKGE